MNLGMFGMPITVQVKKEVLFHYSEDVLKDSIKRLNEVYRGKFRKGIYGVVGSKEMSSFTSKKLDKVL